MAEGLSHESWEQAVREMALRWDANGFNLNDTVRSAIAHHCALTLEHAAATGMTLTVDTLWWFGAGGQADAILNFQTPWANIPADRNGAYIASACMASMMLSGSLLPPPAVLDVPDTLEGIDDDGRS